MGLLLPRGVVQPFEILFSRDDLHVIVNLTDHPAYEAVEAMVRLAPGRPPRVRAIITRHDQTQVDHVSDPRLAVTSWAAARETVERGFALERSDEGGRPRARLSFTSFAGEAIEIDFTALAPPSRDRGGLTDPGDHAATVSLPLMRRLASALAAPGTAVIIDGHRHLAPAWRRIEPERMAHHGFLNDGHPMGVVRAAEVGLVLRAQPSQLAPGERWRFDTPFGERSYCITEQREGGVLAIRRDGVFCEHILAVPRGDRLDLHHLRVTDSADDEGGFVLDFTERDAALGIDSETALVTGTHAIEPDGAIVLRPGQPAWAARRPLRVQFAAIADGHLITTRIGAPASA